MMGTKNATDLVKQDTNKAINSEESKHLINIFRALMVATIIIIGWILYDQEPTKKLIEIHHPNFITPTIGDFTLSIKIALILIVIIFLAEKLFFHFSIISSKYTNPNDQLNYEKGINYRKILAINQFKLFFFFGLSLLGYSIFYKSEFLPSGLGGSGDFSHYYKAGYPGYLFLPKTELLELFYMTGVAYYIVDLIWLVFIYEMKQKEFYLLFLHHLCTICLILFSHFNLLSNLGGLILMIHNIGDTFTFFTRIALKTDMSRTFKIRSAIMLLGVLIFTRLYIFGKIIFCGLTLAKLSQEIGFMVAIFLILILMHLKCVVFISQKIHIELGKTNFSKNEDN